MPSALLAEKVAVVTGAGRGIGREIARVLHAHGAEVVLADLDADAAAQAAAEVDGTGVGCDVTAEDQMKRLVADTVAKHGRLDLFVNNAGITRDASLKRMTVADFDAVVTVHLRGTWLGVREATAVMREQKSGSIVNISSLSGKSGNPGQTNYSAAKAGIIGLTKAAAKEVAHHNVRVNAIQPGLIRTPMTETMPAEVFAEREAAVPMKRAGEPAEVAGAVVFLGSDLSSYITGSVIEVGGGRYM
ncbi:3-oxoacyl-ACP reductase FabG [Mycolicibacterium thermoresistibile]|uniref:3-ketoacyl-(Acyl-carrier-protein) reductase n=2 Tax=Mycolicibacterium thermoresistibile TaxID=1797 RepID=G7CC06_MYCT3|nr:3-oxoacyl-ACP reductase FabG [Mycolicibacterium thermoresistibile]EHI14503.1 3-ketoacyl-(acyl-carrier-protein) reductase [Mycolicibacterium thermoresistibile ATCC 19527]MCV7187409.1 3-oxoacyl-ACP reductase FabG [Mycolicibacterium thermoresistibile]GAT17019.1 3-ketoacyl-ACP reductase [Mycolicibacterium thermoresistibile]SNW16600.1 3-ketoacyl-ACP reductase [Mycolicibacterium thermoresistibile]